MVRTVPVALIASVVLVAASEARASEYDHLVAKHAAAHGVPEALVRRVIHIESKGNPRIVSKGNYGLMQIRLGTARAMGYTGDADGLLDADTNMTYAVKYLAGAYRVARGNQAQAIRNYQRGYYYQAKAMGLSPYEPVAATQQAAAPDPAMLKDAEDRRKAAEAQHLAAETRRAAAEQQRQAALQSRLEERKRAEAERAAQREAMLRERAERQKAAEDRRAAQRQAAIEQRAALREASQRERAAASEQAAPQSQPGVEQEKVRRAQEVEPQQAARVAVPAPARQARRTEPATAWYNPMRFFNHPAHKAHPYKAAERVDR